MQTAGSLSRQSYYVDCVQISSHSLSTTLPYAKQAAVIANNSKSTGSAIAVRYEDTPVSVAIVVHIHMAKWVTYMIAKKLTKSRIGDLMSFPPYLIKYVIIAAIVPMPKLRIKMCGGFKASF